MSKDKIREIEFNIQENRGVIVAKGSKDSYMNAFEEVELKCSKTTIEILTPMFMSDGKWPYEIDIVTGKDFVGVTRCIKEDEFNERTGKFIAERKADRKYHKAMRNKYRLIRRLLIKSIRELERLERFHYNKIINISAEIAKISNGLK